MPALLPVISGREAVRAFERVGWQVARRKGSHIHMVHPENRAILSIPDHKELDRGTLRSLIRKAELAVGDFVQLL